MEKLSSREIRHILEFRKLTRSDYIDGYNIIVTESYHVEKNGDYIKLGTFHYVIMREGHIADIGTMNGYKDNSIKEMISIVAKKNLPFLKKCFTQNKTEDEVTTCDKCGKTCLYEDVSSCNGCLQEERVDCEDQFFCKECLDEEGYCEDCASLRSK